MSYYPIENNLLMADRGDTNPSLQDQQKSYDTHRPANHMSWFLPISRQEPVRTMTCGLLGGGYRKTSADPGVKGW